MPAAQRRSKRHWRSEARSSPAVRLAARALGKRIRELRIRRELTQEQAAQLAKLDPKHWQTIEAGATNVTLASLVGIGRALRVPVSELFAKA